MNKLYIQRWAILLNDDREVTQSTNLSIAPNLTQLGYSYIIVKMLNYLNINPASVYETYMTRLCNFIWIIDLIVKKKRLKFYYLDLKGHLCRYRCLIWIHGQIMDGWVDGGGWGRFDTQFLSDLHFMSYVFLFIGEVYMHLVALNQRPHPLPRLVRRGSAIWAKAHWQCECESWLKPQKAVTRCT